MGKILVLFVTFFIANQSFSQSDSQDLDVDMNIKLMKTTFQIRGENGACGTGFLILKKNKLYPGRYTQSDVVLITAAHVLDGINGDYAYLLMRDTINSIYKTFPYKFNIRIGKLNFYRKHPTMDVAAIYITLPSNFNYNDIFNETWLSGDRELIDYKIRTGETINCLGYPLCITDSLGNFPILRSGKIASYPLVPSNVYKTFYFDFEIYGGNSGGPVYFFKDGSNSSPIGQNQFKIGGRNIQFIMGLVIQQEGVRIKDEVTGEVKETFLKLGVVIQAPFILETLNLF